MSRILFASFIILIAFSSCYYDSEEYLFPELSSNCDTLNVTYTNSIQPIIANSCLSCHSNSASGISGGGIRLEDYADVKANADNGILYQAITRSVNSMPKDASRLSDCKIKTFKIWIDNNSPNN